MQKHPLNPHGKISALVPAAGSGTRLGLGPKAFVKLGGLTLIEWVVNALKPVVNHILVGVPAEHLDRAQNLIGNSAEAVPGQNSRQKTIQSLLDRCNSDWIVIHDATRPLASTELIRRTIEAGQIHQAAGTFMPCHVPIGDMTRGLITASRPSEQMRLSQSPQTYAVDLLREAYRIANVKRLESQTTWQLLLSTLGLAIFPVMGEDFNLKITTPVDLAFAEWACKTQPELRRRSQIPNEF